LLFSIHLWIQRASLEASGFAFMAATTQQWPDLQTPAKRQKAAVGRFKQLASQQALAAR